MVVVVVSSIDILHLRLSHLKQKIRYLIRWCVTILKRLCVNVISYTDDTDRAGCNIACNNCFSQANDPLVSVFTNRSNDTYDPYVKIKREKCNCSLVDV